MNLISLDIRMLRSLISVVDTGSITETARRLGRTQPAISLQIQRLEDITGKVLFQHEGRRMALTPDGDMVLAYAKSILRLHDELLSRLSSPEVHGHVVLGTPDLYAAYMLPSILSVFKEAFPRIQVELRCALSTPTVDRVQRGEVDVALVTRMNNFTGGLVIHQEQLVWIVGEHSRAQFEDPVRLALLPPGNIYREHAIESSRARRPQMANRLRERKRQRPAGRGVRRHGDYRAGALRARDWNARTDAEPKVFRHSPRSTCCSTRRPARRRPRSTHCTIISRIMSVCHQAASTRRNGRSPSRRQTNRRANRSRRRAAPSGSAEVSSAAGVAPVVARRRSLTGPDSSAN